MVGSLTYGLGGWGSVKKKTLRRGEGANVLYSRVNFVPRFHFPLVRD